MGRFVNGYSSAGGRWAVRSVCCEEGPADGVEGHGEDGEDERDESPARAEGRDDHGGPTTGGIMKRCSLAPSWLSSWLEVEKPRGALQWECCTRGYGRGMFPR